jgi:hypothetical protein
MLVGWKTATSDQELFDQMTELYLGSQSVVVDVRIPAAITYINRSKNFYPDRLSGCPFSVFLRCAALREHRGQNQFIEMSHAEVSGIFPL